MTLVTNPALLSISDSLQDVLAGRAKFTTLQRLVDRAVIDDLLPNDLPASVRDEIYELQTVLELIAEHQATHMGLASSYSTDQIASLLGKFSDPLSG
jgi:hypothetical protein